MEHLLGRTLTAGDIGKALYRVRTANGWTVQVEERERPQPRRRLTVAMPCSTHIDFRDLIE